jgi:hypothetical protein
VESVESVMGGRLSNQVAGSDDASNEVSAQQAQIQDDTESA